MSAARLVVAAHGHGDGSQTNRLVAELARRAAAFAGISSWGLAFHKGSPGFSEAGQPDSVVVPLLTSEGYYLEKLQISLADSTARLTEPVGTSPWMADLVAARVLHVLRGQRWKPEETSLLLIGHGTRRSQGSRQATIRLASELSQGPLHEVRAAFLDDEPGPEALFPRLGGKYQLVLPFLIGPGDHAKVDLPARLGPLPETALLDQPLGQDLSLAELIAERACGRLPGFATQGGKHRWSIL